MKNEFKQHETRILNPEVKVNRKGEGLASDRPISERGEKTCRGLEILIHSQFGT